MSTNRESGGRQWTLSGWQAVERLLDVAVGSPLNPLRNLGAIGFLALWLLAASGALLYVFFDTSVAGAYRSVESLARLPLGFGHLLRGLHRYAADLLALAIFLHIVREWLHGHARGARRFHWLTGIPLVFFSFVSAIGGFWLGWDQLGQYSAVATAEWLDALPLLGAPLARNFLSAHAVSDRLFSLFIFVHIGVPLLLMFGLWFHIQRLAHVAVLPPRALTLGLIAMLAALALLQPVLSHAPAIMNRVPESVRLDWLLLWLHPLTDATSRAFTWALAGGMALLLFALPFLPQPRRAAVAVVDADHCSGCRRCFADCPYAAITMVPHPARAERLLAQVDADLCVSCGICAGACPSSTPFRGASTLHTGIDMPQLPIDTLRQRLRANLAASPAGNTVVMYTCDHGARGTPPSDANVSVHRLLCAGQLPPSFVEYALRNGAAGVLIATCREGGCAFRLGQRWTAERLDRRREPHLRAHVSPGQIEWVQAGRGDERLLDEALQRLRQRTAVPHQET
jgi:quinol-cytochrome oxidoreductase complex cytochrome b subunit/coenzyme F420-reducing hydrogenase delta subunit/Pyruvate/2-oxoacid:ferredoxin oxidoreductase delta subunit